MNIGKLKHLLGILETDTTKDAQLLFVMEDVQETILNYCNLDVMPLGLVNTAFRMAMDLYRCDVSGQGSTPMTVSSVSEGDTSTSFTSAADALSGGILKDYQGQLNRYRKVVW